MNTRTKKKISTAGGTGYIGSHTTVKLQNAEYEVAIIDDLLDPNIEVFDGIEEITDIHPGFIQLDLKDEEGTRKALGVHPGIKSITLFVASEAVGESVQRLLKHYRNNIVTLVNLLEMMPRFDIEDIAFSSSCTVYGQPDPENLPVIENALIKPAMFPYGDTKQINEEIIRGMIHAGAPFKSIVLRYSSPTSAHPSTETGELPDGVPQSLVPYLTQAVAGIHKELSVSGDDYDIADGSRIRDYINIVDLAKVRVIAMDRMPENKFDEHVEIFNLGTGNGVSILELINTLKQTAGVRVPHKIAGRREGDIEKVWANSEHANEVLGWTIRETLADILQSAWNWQKRLGEHGIQQIT